MRIISKNLFRQVSTKKFDDAIDQKANADEGDHTRERDAKHDPLKDDRCERWRVPCLAFTLVIFISACLVIPSWPPDPIGAALDRAQVDGKGGRHKN